MIFDEIFRENFRKFSPEVSGNGGFSASGSSKIAWPLRARYELLAEKPHSEAVKNTKSTEGSQWARRALQVVVG